MTQTASYRVYYEDTDAGGVVYYANYLRFAERARTDWLRELGFNQSQLAKEMDLLIVVRRASVEFLAPARLDDILVIETFLKEIGKVRMTVQQSIKREDKQIAALEVELACIGTQGKPMPWPEKLLSALKIPKSRGNTTDEAAAEPAVSQRSVASSRGQESEREA